jgi:DUF3047 family protein
MFLCLFLNSILMDFNADPVGGLPRRWEARGGSASAVYQIKAEADGNRYLAAQSKGADVQLGVQLAMKDQEAPVLSWRWRIWELPRGADERNLKTLDSAAAVYAVFGSRLFPRILKYVWSTSVPAGRSFKHPNSGRMAIIVVDSGSHSFGQWHSVTRNLVVDYKAAFGSLPGNLIALGVKTDSDSTHSSAQADYDDIRLVRP